MDVHKCQLEKIKWQNKYEELKKRQQQADADYAKLRTRVKEFQVPDKRYKVELSAETSDENLAIVEKLLFEGIQKINFERGRRAAQVK